MDTLIVFATFPDEETARHIGTTLVERQLAACVNVFPRVISIYSWNDSLQADNEAFAAIKTTRDRYPELEETLRKNHPYDVPEILAVTVERGLEPYLQWVDRCVSRKGALSTGSPTLAGKSG